eukprot:gene33639-41504_t
MSCLLDTITADVPTYSVSEVLSLSAGTGRNGLVVKDNSGEIYWLDGNPTASSAQDGGAATSAGGSPSEICYDKTHDIIYAGRWETIQMLVLEALQFLPLFMRPTPLPTFKPTAPPTASFVGISLDYTIVMKQVHAGAV